MHKLIVVEGIDACGKATHVAHLAKEFGWASYGFPDYTTQLGQVIQRSLKEEWKLTLPPEALARGAVFPTQDESLILQALMVANRLESVAKIQGLREHQALILDRYWPSSFAYGAAQLGEYILTLNAALPQADLYILLDIPAQESFNRRSQRRDKHELDLALLSRAADYYRYLWNLARQRGFAGKWVMVSGEGSEVEVYQRLFTVVTSLAL